MSVMMVRIVRQKNYRYLVVDRLDRHLHSPYRKPKNNSPLIAVWFLTCAYAHKKPVDYYFGLSKILDCI